MSHPVDSNSGLFGSSRAVADGTSRHTLATMTETEFRARLNGAATTTIQVAPPQPYAIVLPEMASYITKWLELRDKPTSLPDDDYNT